MSKSWPAFSKACLDQRVERGLGSEGMITNIVVVLRQG
jgi:hypothetical protein